MHASLLVLCLSLMTAGAGPSTPSSTGLLASVKAYEAAANRHDWQGMQPLLADRLVIDLGDGMNLEGRDGAGRLHEWEWAMETRIAYSDCRVAGKTVTCRATEENDFLRTAGLGAITYSAASLTFEDGRVTRLSSVLSDESAAVVGSFMESFLTWAKDTDPKGLSKFYNEEQGSFTFGRDGAMVLKRLVRTYVLTKGGRARVL